jgi:hypothetical protein
MTLLNKLPIYHLCFSSKKAYYALRYMLKLAQQNNHSSVNLHILLNACYFAEKRHLNMYWRPVFGATYRAMPYGPVPLEIYEMIKGDPLWLNELGQNNYPWRLEGYHLIATENGPLDPRNVSSSDLKVLQYGFTLACKLKLNEHTVETHDLAWHRAKHGYINYADMVDESNPDREAILESLYEDSHLWRL